MMDIEDMTNSDYGNNFIIETDDEMEEIEDKLKLCKIKEAKQKDDFYYILSIDIGIQHLGISVIETDKEFNFRRVEWIDLINIMEFHCDRKTCHLYHTGSFTDRIAHVIDNNRKFFEDTDFILIERQPPQGLVAIEQMIFAIYRHKSFLISPNSVHKHFKMGQHDYEGRKRVSERIALHYLNKDNGDFVEQFGWYERRHDISDSILFSIYWCNKKKQDLLNKRLRKEQQQKFEKMTMKLKSGKVVSACEMLEQFRHIPIGICNLVEFY